MTRALTGLSGECLSVLGRPGADPAVVHWFATGTVALSAALRAAVRAAGLTRSPRVVMPAAVCPQVYLAARAAELRPVFVTTRIEDGEYKLDLRAVENVPAGDAAALVWVHQYGAVSDRDAVVQLCRRKGWVLIEDAALAFGAGDGHRQAGTMGDVAILSFGTGKVIDAGYGGAAVVNEGPYAEALGTLIADEDAAANHPGAGQDAEKVMAGFDREFKQIYNTKYEALRTGRLAAEVGHRLDACAAHRPALDPQRLLLALPPGRLLEAPQLAATRTERAAWWADQLHGAGAHLRIVRHATGTYWRLNVRLDPAVRHGVLRAGIAAGVPISSWHPPLDWLVTGADVLGSRDTEREFADEVINLWVEGIEDWPRYARQVIELLERAPAPAAVTEAP